MSLFKAAMVSEEELRELREQAAEWVCETLDPDKYLHTMRVVDTAISLADIFGMDREKAALAAVLHDCARDMSDAELLEAALGYGLRVRKVERKNPLLLHAPVGAEIARRMFDIDDPEILGAISYHTTGHKNMTDFQKLIFISDNVEPGRSYPGVNKIRKAIFREKDLDKAVLISIKRTLKYLESRGRDVDKRIFKLRKAVRRSREERKAQRKAQKKEEKATQEQKGEDRRGVDEG